MNEIERENLITAISEISIDFKDDFIADKLILRDFKNDISIEVSILYYAQKNHIFAINLNYSNAFYLKIFLLKVFSL